MGEPYSAGAREGRDARRTRANSTRDSSCKRDTNPPSDRRVVDTVLNPPDATVHATRAH